MGYGLDSQGLNSGMGKIFLFSTMPRPDLGPTQPIKYVPQGNCHEGNMAEA
jgi:hypothetical protein